ncbi:hypothetical protein BH23GEM3_BH23GEM3_03470 [soil metagenome]
MVAVVHGRASLALGDARAGRPATAELERLVEASEDLGGMLRDVLEMLRGGRLSSEVRFCPVRVVERTVRRFLDGAPSVEIRLSSSLPARAEVAGRASFLARAVLNLLGNAARHARHEIHLTLSVVEEEAAPAGQGSSSSVLVLRVEDDGAGVSASLVPQLFEPLVRGERPGAAGLGLSSARWAVEQLDGRVLCCTGARLSGAAFELRVPLHVSAAAGEMVLPRQVLTGKKLVLIEDDAAVQEALSRLLRRLGAEVLTLPPAGVGEEEMLRQLLGALPDAVLLDLRLGRREGTELWRALRAQVPTLAERVIFLSALAPGDAAWDEAAATGQPLLAKPLDLSALASALLRVCPEHGG